MTSTDPPSPDATAEEVQDYLVRFFQHYCGHSASIAAERATKFKGNGRILHRASETQLSILYPIEGRTLYTDLQHFRYDRVCVLLGNFPSPRCKGPH